MVRAGWGFDSSMLPILIGGVMERVAMKHCSGCGEKKHYEQFYRDRTAMSGRQSICVLCTRLSQASALKRMGLQTKVRKSIRIRYDIWLDAKAWGERNGERISTSVEKGLRMYMDLKYKHEGGLHEHNLIEAKNEKEHSMRRANAVKNAANVARVEALAQGLQDKEGGEPRLTKLAAKVGRN